MCIVIIKIEETIYTIDTVLDTADKLNTNN